MTATAGGAKLEALTPRRAMSEEQLKAFMEAVKADAELQEKLKAAVDSDSVVAIAKAAGFLISAEELARAKAEVSEDELEGVAGGACDRNFCCGTMFSGSQNMTNRKRCN